MTEAKRLEVILMAMEGKALSWYQWWENNSVNPIWEGFKIVVIRKFQSLMVQNPYELLLGLKQMTTVEEFREKFELYAGPL